MKKKAKDRLMKLSPAAATQAALSAAAALVESDAKKDIHIQISNHTDNHNDDNDNEKDEEDNDTHDEKNNDNDNNLNEDDDKEDSEKETKSERLLQEPSTSSSSSSSTSSSSSSNNDVSNSKVIYTERITPVALAEWLLSKLAVTEVVRNIPFILFRPVLLIGERQELICFSALPQTIA